EPLIRELLYGWGLAPVHRLHRLGEIGLRRIRQRLDRRARHPRAPELWLERFRPPKGQKYRRPAAGHRDRGLSGAHRLWSLEIQLEAIAVEADQAPLDRPEGRLALLAIKGKLVNHVESTRLERPGRFHELAGIDAKPHDLLARQDTHLLELDGLDQGEQR